MKNNRLLIKLLPHIVAIFMILTTIIFLTIAYGWFSNNEKVNANSETVNVFLPVVVLASSTYEPKTENERIAQDTLGDNGFGVKIGFSPTNPLYPTSTPDGVSYRYATNVDKSGIALDTESEDLLMFEPVEDIYKKYFYIEQTFYLCTTNKEDITIYLSNVSIQAGTSESNLYKSIRVALLTEDDTLIVKHENGDALPANGDDTVCETDPAIYTTSIDNSSLRIVLPGVTYNDVNEKNYCSPVKVILRLWIEGQSPFAVAEYSGHAFLANLDFDVLS